MRSWKRIGELTPPVRNCVPALAWDEALGAVVMIVRTSGELTAWQLDDDRWQLIGRRAEKELHAIAAAYDPARRAVVVVGTHYRDDGRYGLRAWTLGRGLSPLRLRVEATFDGADLAVCADRRGERLLVSTETELWSLVGDRIEAATGIPEDESVRGLVYDEERGVPLLLGAAGVFPLGAAAAAPPDGWDAVAAGVYLPDTKQTFVVCGPSATSFLVGAGKPAKLRDRVPGACWSPSLAYDRRSRRVIAAGTFGETMRTFAVRPGSGAEAWRSLDRGLPAGFGRMLSGERLLHVDDHTGSVHRWEGDRWSLLADVSRGGPPAEQPREWATALAPVGRLLVYTPERALYVLSPEGKWTGKSRKADPGPRQGATLVAATWGVLLFGGRDARGKALGDAWILRGASWSRVTAKGPSRRERAEGVVIDGGAAVLVRGGSLGGDPLHDAWRFDGTKWSSIGGERARASATAFQPATGRSYDVANGTLRVEGVGVRGARRGAGSPEERELRFEQHFADEQLGIDFVRRRLTGIAQGAANWTYELDVSSHPRCPAHARAGHGRSGKGSNQSAPRPALTGCCESPHDDPPRPRRQHRTGCRRHVTPGEARSTSQASSSEA